MRKIIITITLLITAALIRAESPGEAITKTPLKDKIKFYDLNISSGHDYNRNQNIEIKDRNNKLWTFKSPVNYGIQLTCSDGRNKIFYEELDRITEIGTLELAKKEYIYFTAYQGGTGVTYTIFNLIDLQKLELITSSMFILHDLRFPYYVLNDNGGYGIDYKNYDNPLFRQEKNFLDSIKYEYGYISEEGVSQQPDNPKYAYYFWYKENKNVKDGKLKIKKYKGKPFEEFYDALFQIEDKDFIYAAYGKAEVIAYDKVKNEHYVLWHPYNTYNWAECLVKKDNYLFIGTRGEGLVIINLDTFYLKRIQLKDKWNIVAKIEIDNNKIKINDGEINGSEIIDFVNF